MQMSTLYAGLRPFGVSFLIAGSDVNGPHLIESDPSGMLYEWKAYAIGRGASIANKMLDQMWKPNMNEADAVKLAVDVLSKTEKSKKETTLDMAIIKSGGEYKKINGDRPKTDKK